MDRLEPVIHIRNKNIGSWLIGDFANSQAFYDRNTTSVNLWWTYPFKEIELSNVGFHA